MKKWKFFVYFLFFLFKYFFFVFSGLIATGVVYPCRKCGKIFQYKKTMWNHTRYCGEEKQHSCQLCGKKFQQKHHLGKHLKTVHKFDYINFDVFNNRDSKDWFSNYQ